LDVNANRLIELGEKRKKNEQFDLSIRDSYNFSCANWAAYHGDFGLVSKLIKAKEIVIGPIIAVPEKYQYINKFIKKI